MPMALSDIDASSWISFILGGGVLLFGLYLGTLVAPAKAKEDKKELMEAKVQAEAASMQLQEAGDNQTIATAAAQSKSAYEQIASIIASLPEYQRFPGMLILLGAALMGVAVIQFGGTSLF